MTTGFWKAGLRSGLSGSARNSSRPRGIGRAPGTVPEAASSGGSRRSMKTAPPLACSAFASAGEIRGTAALAAATSSFTVVGIGLPPWYGRQSLAQRIRQDEAEQRRRGDAQHGDGQVHAGGAEAEDLGLPADAV